MVLVPFLTDAHAVETPQEGLSAATVLILFMGAGRSVPPSHRLFKEGCGTTASNLGFQDKKQHMKFRKYFYCLIWRKRLNT